MKQNPIDHSVKEEGPTETQRSYGMVTAGVAALLAIGTAIYWAS